MVITKQKQYLIKAAISHLLRLRVVTGARPPAGVLRLNYLLQQLLLRPPGLLLLLGLQRLGDLGDGDEAVRLAEHQRVQGLEQLHPRDASGAVPVLLLPLLGPLLVVGDGVRAVRDERDVVARVGAHDLGGAGGPVEALDAAARVLHHHRRRLRRLAVAHRRSLLLLSLPPVAVGVQSRGAEGRQDQARASWWWCWRRPRSSGGVMIYEAAVGGGWSRLPVGVAVWGTSD